MQVGLFFFFPCCKKVCKGTLNSHAHVCWPVCFPCDLPSVLVDFLLIWLIFRGFRITIYLCLFFFLLLKMEFPLFTREKKDNFADKTK